MSEVGGGETNQQVNLNRLLAGSRTEEEAEARMAKAGVPIPDEWMNPLYRASIIQTGATGVVAEANVSNTAQSYADRLGGEQTARNIAFARNVTGSGIPPTPNTSPAKPTPAQTSTETPKK